MFDSVIVRYYSLDTVRLISVSSHLYSLHIHLLRILLTQPWDTLSWREMTQGLTPAAAISMILSLMWFGRGRPLMKTPPSWLTRPWPEDSQRCLVACLSALEESFSRIITIAGKIALFVTQILATDLISCFHSPKYHFTLNSKGQREIQLDFF